MVLIYDIERKVVKKTGHNKLREKIISNFQTNREELAKHHAAMNSS